MNVSNQCSLIIIIIELTKLTTHENYFTELDKKKNTDKTHHKNKK